MRRFAIPLYLIASVLVLGIWLLGASTTAHLYAGDSSRGAVIGEGTPAAGHAQILSPNPTGSAVDLFLPIVLQANNNSATPTATPTVPGVATPKAPVIFFADLESGPNTGGQNNLGAFITLYGEGFGAMREDSIVTIGSHEVAHYVSWGENNAAARSLDMIVVQPGSQISTGSIVVTVGGRPSNPLPFTVRSGQIYFVIPDAPNADDANPGTYTAPFKTLYRPRQVMEAGDIVYIRGGNFGTADPQHLGWDAVLFVFPETDANGTNERPIAYIGYPGEPPVLGGDPPMRRGILVDGAINHYIFANLRFTHHAGMLELSGNGHRIIGNYSVDGIFSNSGVIGISGNSAHYAIYGNFMRNNGEPGEKLNGSAFYLQGFGTNADIDFGWNQIQEQRGARAIQLYGHDDGDRIENIRIHDNLLTGSELNNITLGGSDGNTEVLGTIYVYNNLIVGSGDPGLRINDPQATIVVQNNTFYGNGSPGFDGNAQIYVQRAGTGRITLQNNIVYADTGQTYFLFEQGVDAMVFMAANNNLVFNAGPCPQWVANCRNADPLFVQPVAADFHLQANSPAIDAGIQTNINVDYAGISRPQGGAYDIGAFEYVTDTVTIAR